MDELRWGNRYFLNMQEPAGYVMSHVGGDALRHGDGNRWTDNIIGPEGGEPATIDPTPGGSSSKITIVGRQGRPRHPDQAARPPRPVQVRDRRGHDGPPDESERPGVLRPLPGGGETLL